MIARLIHWSGTIASWFFWSCADRRLGLYSALNYAAGAIPICPIRQGDHTHHLSRAAAAGGGESGYYPLTTTLLSVPHAKTVRGYSLSASLYVYVCRHNGTCTGRASRVLEYLSQVQGRLPATARAALGPDATASLDLRYAWWIAAARMTSASCARFRTGF